MWENFTLCVINVYNVHEYMIFSSGIKSWTFKTLPPSRLTHCVLHYIFLFVLHALEPSFFQICLICFLFLQSLPWLFLHPNKFTSQRFCISISIFCSETQLRQTGAQPGSVHSITLARLLWMLTSDKCLHLIGWTTAALYPVTTQLPCWHSKRGRGTDFWGDLYCDQL